jgi:putative ATP-binding cassette transporter
LSRKEHGVNVPDQDQDQGLGDQRFFRDFLRLTGGFWREPGSWRPRIMTGLLIAVVISQVLLAIRFNMWSADLFDALERRSTDGAMAQIGIFAVIVLATMATNTTNMVLRRWLQFAWRRWLTVRVLGYWMEDARHYQAGLIPGDHGNPDGRIAEDIRISTEAAVELGASLFNALLILISFVGILWSLSGVMEIRGIHLPGHLVLLALTYAGSGALVAFVLGRPLVRATNQRQTKEANFRFSLVQAREGAEPIALARGEASERTRLGAAFETIALAWRAQSTGLARLVSFTSGYGSVAGVLPILVGTWRFLNGTLTLGGLMQSAQAFQQVTSALSWPIDNLPRIAEWRASVERVLALEDAVRIVRSEAARTGDTAINLHRDGPDLLGVSNLWVASPDGDAMLSDVTLQMKVGEHVLVDGDGDAAAALFRVLAGIWPWGSGKVDLPPDSTMIATGSRPFLPEGRLRDALTFHALVAEPDDETLALHLRQVGLDHLAPRLDESADWARSLSPAEQQRLSVARLLLNRPSWIVLGDATDALDPVTADRMLELLREAMPNAAIVVIGRHPGSADLFHRHVTLDRTPNGEILLHEIHASREARRRVPARRSVVQEWLRAWTQSSAR